MFGNMGNMMKQAQQMQAKMEKAQEELKNMTITGVSGGGMVKVLMNGQHKIEKVDIEEDAMDDKEMLEDLIAAAVNDAVNKLTEAQQKNMADMMGGLNLPPGFKMPF